MTILSDPQTRDELQEAAELARALLRIEAARRYGLVTGGPKVHVARCQRLIERAIEAGVEIREAQIDAAVLAFAGGA